MKLKYFIIVVIIVMCIILPFMLNCKKEVVPIELYVNIYKNGYLTGAYHAYNGSTDVDSASLYFKEFLEGKHGLVTYELSNEVQDDTTWILPGIYRSGVNEISFLSVEINHIRAQLYEDSNNLIIYDSKITVVWDTTGLYK